MEDFKRAVEFYEKGEFEKAYKIFYKFATVEKSSEAQLYLGMMYEAGEGLQCDIEIAKSWYKKSYRQKNLDAGFRLQSIEQTTTCRC
jgi:TPR repeat protein